VLLGAIAVACGSACRGRPASPPYAAGAAPSAEALRAAAEPAISALIVPQARLRERGRPGALLMLAAQTDPPRLAGSLTAAGHELVSLAVTERGYGLRWLADGRPRGFYEGPASACAVEAALGVALPPEDLVRLLLGGAPVLAPAEVKQQLWRGERVRRRSADPHRGHEILRLAGADGEQELRFSWLAGRWWFSGTTLWSRTGDGRAMRLSIDHEGLRSVGPVVLPRRTTIRAPIPDGELELVIDYAQQRPDPGELAGDAPAAADPWEEGEWEDADAGEDADADAGEHAGETPPPDAGAADPLPPVFRIDGAGLPSRGDLCARR
jgi:hypothetical protein